LPTLLQYSLKLYKNRTAYLESCYISYLFLTATVDCRPNVLKVLISAATLMARCCKRSPSYHHHRRRRNRKICIKKFKTWVL